LTEVALTLELLSPFDISKVNLVGVKAVQTHKNTKYAGVVRSWYEINFY